MRLLAAIAAAFAGIRRTRVAPPALAFALFAALAVIPAENVRAHSDNCTESNHYKPNNLDDPCLRSDQAEFYDWCVDNGGTPDANASGVVTCSNISSETCRAANFFALDFTRCQNPSSNPYFLCRQSNNGNAEYDFASAPHACKCNEGALGNAAEGECAPPSPLAPEIQSASPNLASIVALLDANEDPNGTDGNGNSLLAIAVTLGHLEVMSVLITAGANPSVTIADTGSDRADIDDLEAFSVPHYYAVNNMHMVKGPGSFEWPRAAELLFAFGNAVDIAEDLHTYTYDWDAVVGGGSVSLRAVAYLPRRYELTVLSPTEADREAIFAMAHYLTVSKQSACTLGACGTLTADNPDYKPRPICEASGGSAAVPYCGFCSGANVRSVDGGSCVAANACDGLSVLGAHDDYLENACVCNEDSEMDGNGECKCKEAGKVEDVEAGECVAVADFFGSLLLAEVQSASPNLASVVALLSLDANPNYEKGRDRPLLAAVRGGHAEIVSTLVAARADPSVEFSHSLNIPEYIARNSDGHSWPRAARLLFAFGDAVSLAGLSSTVDWNSAEQNSEASLADRPLEWLTVPGRYDPHDPSRTAGNAAILAMAAYLRAQGSSCRESDGGRTFQQWDRSSPLCDYTGPTCPATGGGGHSCGQCAGFPLRSPDGKSCVSDCGAAAATEESDTIHLERGCVCPEGRVAGQDGVCSSATGDLLAEIRRENPNTASILALLDEGATFDGMLRIAVTMGHAEVVSVLITAGANPSLRVRDATGFLQETIPIHLVRNVSASLPWRDAVDMLFHFGGAVDIAEVQREFNYDWDTRGWDGRRASRIRNAVGHAYLSRENDALTPTAADKDAALVMAHYLRGKGASCRDYEASAAFCALSAPTCPMSGGAEAVAYCGLCPDSPLRGAGGACVAECGERETPDDDSYLEGGCACEAGAIFSGDGCYFPPAAAGSFRASLVGGLDSPTVSLSWAAVDGRGVELSGYVLWRESVVTTAAACSADAFAGEFSEALTLTADDEVSHLDADNVEHGNCYGYALAATTGLLGARTTTAIHVRDVPGPPTGFSAATLSDGSVSLSWGAPDKLRGSRIDGWRVFRRVNMRRPAQLTLTGADAFFHVDAFPPSGSTLAYHVRAQSDAERDGGRGEPSEESAEIVTEGDAADYDAPLVSVIGVEYRENADADAGLVREYLRLGADANVTTASGAPALLLAAQWGYAEIARALLEWGADATARHPDHGGTAAHLAANADSPAPASGAAGVLRALAELPRDDIDWNAADNAGSRPLDYLQGNYGGETDAENRRRLAGAAFYMARAGARCADASGDLCDWADSGAAPRCGMDSETGFPVYYRLDDSGAETTCGCAEAGEFQVGAHCVRREGELTGAEAGNDELEDACESLGGKPEKAGEGGLLCLELDASGTFCLLSSREALPCEGLLKHVRDCNYQNRIALNPFLCGRACLDGEHAAGGKCCAPDGACRAPNN